MTTINRPTLEQLADSAAHLTAEPLRTAWTEGYNTGLLQASAMGAPVYARIGFRSHGDMALFVRMPESDQDANP